MDLYNFSAHLPLIAILRGTTPKEIVGQAEVLIEAGFSIIEVPLNSPDALSSIKLLVETFGHKYLLGAGTVYNEELAKKVIDTGANLIVSPNTNIAVINKAIAAKCVCIPGVFTPTEAFTALEAGASGLKLYPISAMGVAGMKALLSVLPKKVACFPVGGINADIECMRAYIEAGAYGFGLGSGLYRSKLSKSELKQNALAYVNTFQFLRANNQ